ncbi:MAG: DUF3368 domain-containing protein [Crenarchaeota archaeon]|nr:DUF3368 domain-containing protein [Thermoproteota archaeon]
MSKIVSNATPLIYLAKIDKLDFLQTLFTDVFIAQEVKLEVVDKGKTIGKKDAYLVENAINAGWIKVLNTPIVDTPIPLDLGETATLSLAKNLNIKEVLIDEASARLAAKLLGLTPRGTLFVILKNLKKNQINLEQFIETLNQLTKQGFRLKQEIYLQAIQEAKKITNQQ